MPFDGSTFRVQPPRLLPAGQVEIDRTHPLAQGLMRLWLFSVGGAPRDICAIGAAAASAGQIGVSTSASQIGPVSTWQASPTGGWQDTTSGPLLGGLSAWSIHAVAATAAPGNSGGRALYSERAASGNDIIRIGQSNGSKTTLGSVYRNDSGAIVLNEGNTNISDGAFHSLAAIFTGTALAQYVDGTLDVSAAWSSNNAFTETVVRSFGWDAADSTAQWAAGSVACVGLYAAPLTADNVAWLAAEPFAMLRPLYVRRVYAASGVAPNTLTGSAVFGSLLSSGTLAATQAAAGAAAFRSLASAGAATQTQALTASGSLQFAATGTLALTQGLAATGTLGTFGAAGSAALAQSLTAAGILGALVATGSGAQAAAMTGAATVGGVIAAASAQQSQALAGTGLLGALSAATVTVTVLVPDEIVVFPADRLSVAFLADPLTATFPTDRLTVSF